MDEKTSNKHDGNDDWLEAELADTSTRITSLNFQSPLFQKKFAKSIRNHIQRRLNDDNIFTTCFGSRLN